MAELEHDAPAPLAVEAEQGGGEAVVKLAGDLDISSVEQLRSVVAELVAERPRALVFDMRELRFMDSAGIAVLLGAVSQVESVRLLSPSRAVRRVLELTGLTDVLAIEQ